MVRLETIDEFFGTSQSPTSTDLLTHVGLLFGRRLPVVAKFLAMTIEKLHRIFAMKVKARPVLTTFEQMVDIWKTVLDHSLIFQLTTLAVCSVFNQCNVHIQSPIHSFNSLICVDLKQQTPSFHPKRRIICKFYTTFECYCLLFTCFVLFTLIIKHRCGHRQ